jgi:hypothetical protein
VELLIVGSLIVDEKRKEPERFRARPNPWTRRSAVFVHASEVDDPVEAATGVCARDPRQALTFAPFTRGEQ